ncbi:MAG: hypothetical protein ACREE0_05890 [Phenylobacterium sp.]|jgi:hypothetical protein
MARKSLTEKRRMQALGDGLRGMFRALERRPVPVELVSVVDQLAEDEAVSPSRKAKCS